MIESPFGCTAASSKLSCANSSVHLRRPPTESTRPVGMPHHVARLRYLSDPIMLCQQADSRVIGRGGDGMGEEGRPAKQAWSLLAIGIQLLMSISIRRTSPTVFDGLIRPWSQYVNECTVGYTESEFMVVFCCSLKHCQPLSGQLLLLLLVLLLFPDGGSPFSYSCE